MLAPHPNWRIAILLALIVSARTATAGPLEDGLERIYSNDPLIAAAQAAVRGGEAGIIQARSALLPDIVGTAEAAGTRGVGNDATPLTFGVGLEQRIYAGGTAFTGIAAAEANVGALRERLRSVVQQAFVSAVTAYADLWRDQTLQRLSEIRFGSIQAQLDEANIRLAAGEGTRTAIAQAEAQRSIASSELALAQTRVVVSASRFRALFGEPSPNLGPMATVRDLLPSTTEMAIATALNDHPAVREARLQVEIASLGADIARGEMMPTVTLFGQATIQTDVAVPGSWGREATIGARVTFPLFGGRERTAALEESRAREDQARHILQSTTSEVTTGVLITYAQLSAAEARVAALQDLVDALTQVLNGIREELNAGRGTTADVVAAQTELHQASVQLANAQRDEVVASYLALAAVGRLSPAALGFAA